MKQYYVYLLSGYSKTIYIGVTNNIERRIFEHKNWIMKWFAEKYNCKKLVYLESFTNIKDAIASEKKLKNRKRQRKIDLIEEKNPDWIDLSLQDSESSSEWQKI